MEKSIKERINILFGAEPTFEQKAWGMINQFYHLVLTKMDKDKITRSDLAKKLNVSRSAVSQMFNKTPNVTVKKMIEIADAVNLELNLTTDFFLKEEKNKEIQRREEVAKLVNSKDNTKKIKHNKKLINKKISISSNDDNWVNSNECSLVSINGSLKTINHATKYMTLQ